MNSTGEQAKISGVVLMMLFVGMAACQGFGITVPPPPEDERILLVGSTWKLQEDLYETIEIVESNLTLDGNGFSVTGSPGAKGVEIVGLTNVVVKDMDITAFSQGIYLSNCTGCSLEYNDLSGNIYGYGVYMYGSSGNDIIGNIATGNIYGIYLSQFSDGNTVEGNDTSSSTYHGIFLNSYCDDNVIIGNTANSNGNCGITVSAYSRYNELANNTITNNGTGIATASSSFQTIVRNVISNNTTGLSLGSSCNSNDIYNNDFINNGTQYSISTSSLGNEYSMDPPIGGNYWSDWSGNDNDGDGLIDDNPRLLTNGTDYYPMIAAYSDRMVMLIENIIDFFDDGVATNGIMARGKTPEIPLGQFRDMLEDALADIIDKDYASACGNLDDALGACDGEKKDLITGPDVETLYNMIVELQITLECE